MNANKRMTNKSPITKAQARRVLEQYKNYVGIALIVSALFGIYLLATDKSLWLLAVSHAYGLVGISAIDLILGLAMVVGRSNKLLIPSAGWAVLTILLQLGDIATAPQYKMSSAYFAHYLFGLWAYDGLLLAQGVIVYLSLSTRSYQKMVAKKKVLTFFDMGLKNSRRDLMQIGGTIGALFAVAGVLGALTILTAPKSINSGATSQSGQGGSTLQSGAVANLNDLKVGSPVYFDFPSSGYPNMLMKKSDGTVQAMSMLCTHVCCQCEYYSPSSEIYCPCHGSVFDASGNVIRGPARTPLPGVELRIDSNGNIFPVKMLAHSACV